MPCACLLPSSKAAFKSALMNQNLTPVFAPGEYVCSIFFKKPGWALGNSSKIRIPDHLSYLLIFPIKNNSSCLYQYIEDAKQTSPVRRGILKPAKFFYFNNFENLLSTVEASSYFWLVLYGSAECCVDTPKLYLNTPAQIPKAG